MMTKTYFFNENSKKSDILKIININSKEVNKYVETISKMKSGNKIGYFQFLHNGIYYKIYIMPKIYKIAAKECIDDCEEYKKIFINFLKNYYRLVAKYNISKYSENLNGNISDLSYESKNCINELASDNVYNIDDYIVHNYKDSIFVIQKFFIKYKKKIFIKNNFTSQTIKSKLNMKRNITELNKSNIHQINHISISYSNIAYIAIEVLKYFMNVKIKSFSSTIKSRELRIVAQKTINKINVRFINNNSNFKLKEILQQKIYKQFNKNDEFITLYKALLKLLGKEHYFKNSNYREIIKEDDMIAIFFQPEKLYEWIVYDKLYTDNTYDNILKEGKDDIEVKYNLIPTVNSKGYSSQPDLIAIKDNNSYPIDVKWKILKSKNASFDNDISKLRRDAKVRKVNKGYLVYPKIDENSEFLLNTEYQYDFDDSFKFELKEMNVD